ncbi:MAG: GGDEF domain-containing protein, partial [Thiohalobacteraceae bacterium]
MRIRYTLLAAALVLGAFLALAFLPAPETAAVYANTTLHAAIEVLGAIPAIFLASLLLAQSRQGARDALLYPVALGLLAMGVLDGFHAVADPTDAGFVWLRSLAALAGGLLPALLWMERGRALQRLGAHRWVILVSALIGTVFLLQPGLLPALDAAGNFALPLRIINVVGGLFAFAALAYFAIRYRRRQGSEDLIFAAFFLVMGASAIVFPFSRLWDTEWWLWHILRLVAYALAIQFMFASHIRLLNGMKQEIDERKATEARIEFLAYHDVLTRLPNRLLAKDHMEMAMSFADKADNKVALLFLDLDNFKTVNDSLGHLVGDALLKATAARLNDCIRATDTLARLGGDEFLVVLADVHNTDIITDVSEHILEQLAQPFDIEGHELSTSFSLGIAVYPD